MQNRAIYLNLTKNPALASMMPSFVFIACRVCMDEVACAVSFVGAFGQTEEEGSFLYSLQSKKLR